jgi:alpha-glucosidase
LARQLVALVCSLRGSVCLYQGEELGLDEADVPYELLRDPYGITFWPTFKGRDGCRTPMPWSDAMHGGFTDSAPWLPVPAAHLAHSVSAQDADPDSTLNAVRTFLRWRKRQPALVQGDIRFLEAREPVLAFTRSDGAQSLLVVFNLSGMPAEWIPPADLVLHVIEDHDLASATIEDGRVRLDARGVLYARIG